MKYKTALNILDENFGWCGCSEEEKMLDEIRKVLDWASLEDKDKRYQEGFPAVYYIVAGILNNLEFIEHGTAIRYPWLTDEGKEFKEIVSKSYDEIDKLADAEFNASTETD